MTPGEHEAVNTAQALDQYITLSEVERAAAVIDTGMFNRFIEAYLTVTLHSMNFPTEQIKQAKRTLKGVLEDTQATEAIALAEDILKG